MLVMEHQRLLLFITESFAFSLPGAKPGKTKRRWLLETLDNFPSVQFLLGRHLQKMSWNVYA